MKDLTKGNEAKTIILFALPILIGNIFQQFYNAVDSVIVGWFIGKTGLGAVGISFPIMFLLISLIMGITMGFTILISQYYGAKDINKVKLTIDTTYIFLFFASIIITIIGLISSKELLRLLGVPKDVMPLANSYLKIIYYGIIATFGYNSISAILRGLGDSKTPMYFLIISTILNIILDWIFIGVFKWGIEGAAWATVISQGFSFIIGFIYLNKTHELFKFKIKNMVFDKEIFYLCLKIGLPSGIQQMFVAAGLMALSSIVNRFGTDTLAAYTAAGKIDSFASMPAIDLSNALSNFVGQNLGANKIKRVKEGYKATLVISSIISITSTILVILFSRFFINIFNSDPNVIKIGIRYFRIVGGFYIIFSIMFVTNGLLKGAGSTIIPMFSSILSLWILRVPVANFLSFHMKSSDGIWWAIPIGWLGGLILSYIYYFIGGWKRNIPIHNK